MRSSAVTQRFDSVYLLQNWGNWARGNPFAALTYPSIEPYRKLYRLPGDDAGRPPVPNETLALDVDQALAKLIQRHELMGVAAALYYMSGMTYIQIADVINRHSPHARATRILVSAWVRAAESWIDGAFAE